MLDEKGKNYPIFAWVICGLGAIFYSYEYFLRISPSVMEQSLRDHFDLTAAGFGFLSAFYYYAYVPMQLPVGILMDHFGPRRLLTFACAICVIGTFFFANTFSFTVAAIGRLLVGFGSAFAFVGVLKLATIWLPEDKLGMVAGAATALGTIGAMVGDNLLGTMVNLIGWQKTINLTGLFGIALAIVLWLGLRDHRSSKKIKKTVPFKDNFLDFAFILKSKQVWINGLYGCLVYLPTTVFAELWGIPYLQHAHNLTQGEANFCNSILFLGFTIGAPSMGYISDKMRRRKLPMLVGSLVAGTLMLIILYAPLTFNSLNLCMFLLGLAYSVQSIVFAVGRELSPKEAGGTAVAMTNMIVMIGAMILQPVVGELLDYSLFKREKMLLINPDTINGMQQLYSTADYQFAMAVIPIGIFLAAILTFFLRETHAHALHHPKS